MALTDDLERMLSDAARLADKVMSEDGSRPGFALAVTRALVRQLSTADALAIVRQPSKRTKPLDPSALIG